MEFIKNFLALMISTAVWFSGFIAIMNMYYLVAEQDVFYFWMLLICILVIALGVLLGKYNLRVKAALEIPMGFFGL